MRHFSRFFLMLIFLISCQKESKKDIDTSGIQVQYSIDRFEQLFDTCHIPKPSEKTFTDDNSFRWLSLENVLFWCLYDFYKQFTYYNLYYKRKLNVITQKKYALLFSIRLLDLSLLIRKNKSKFVRNLRKSWCSNFFFQNPQILESL